MDQRIRNLENFALIAVELAKELEESQHRLEESQRRRGELLQQLPPGRRGYTGRDHTH